MVKKIIVFLFSILSFGLVFSWNIPITNAQDDFVTIEEKIDTGEYIIPAIVTMPNNIVDPVPIVVMLHGTASNKDEAGNGYIYLSERLAEDGIASIRFDFAGSGESERDYEEYTVFGAVEDTEAVLAFLDGYSDLIELMLSE